MDELILGKVSPSAELLHVTRWGIFLMTFAISMNNVVVDPKVVSKTPWAAMGTGRLKGCMEHPTQHLLMFYLLIHISVFWHSSGALLETPSPAAMGSSGCSHLPHGQQCFLLASTFPFTSPYSASSNFVTELEALIHSRLAAYGWWWNSSKRNFFKNAAK